MTRNEIAIVAAALLVWVSITGMGQETSQEIVVTATRLADPLSRVPASVSVFSGQDVQNSPARHVDDVLRSAPGVYVLRSVGMGYGLPVQISLRGVPGQHAVLLLADGLPLNEAITGFASVNEMPRDAVSRIELVRGPYSALYGTDAFAGVVNVLTLDPEQRPAAAVFGRAGNEGFLEWGFQGSGGDRSLGFTADLGGRQIDNYLGHDRTVDEVWDPVSGTYRRTEHPARNYDYEDQRFLGKLTADIGEDTHVDVHVRYSDSELGYGQRDIGPLFPEPADTSLKNESSLLGAVLSSRLLDGAGLKMRAFYREQTQELLGLDLARMDGTIPVFVRSRSETQSHDWLTDVALDLDAGPRHTVTLGLDFQRADANFSPLRDAGTGLALPISAGRKAHTYNAGLYAQDRVAVHDLVTLLCGVRWDEHSAFGSAVSPKVGLRVQAGDDTTLRASAGRAYRAPSLTELFQPTVFFGNVAFESNADLDPEYITSADAGIEHCFGAALRVHVDAFYNDMTDLITKRISGAALRYENTDDAWSAGVESGVTWDFLPDCRISVGYTEQRSENRDTNTDLEHVPERILAVTLRGARSLGDRWLAEANVTENYIGSRGYVDLSGGQWRDLGDYWRTDVSMRLTCRGTVWAGLAVENATDERYREWSLIDPAPGRLYAFELGARW